MISSRESDPAIHLGTVIENLAVCAEHRRMTLRLQAFPEAQPGQFLHLCPPSSATMGYRTFEWGDGSTHDTWVAEWSYPMLRRAFSIAGLTRAGGVADASVIYRVVGSATRWLDSLNEGSLVSVLGPLGNRFPIRRDKRRAWLVAGGVGLPPMLWLAEALGAAGRETVAFCGARRLDLLALTLSREIAPPADARTATLCAGEFARVHTPVVISTDDGSAGFCGHVGTALTAYHTANPVPGDEVVVYTCGPELMMRSVAEYCLSRRIECYVCMERAMACGTGTCQSCVVPVRAAHDPEGWRYRLCCTEGPVFPAGDILWDEPTQARPRAGSAGRRIGDQCGGVSGGGDQHNRHRGS